MHQGHNTHIYRFYKNDLFSDLTITCGDKNFPVHRNVLFVQSPYFRKLLGGSFKVYTLDRSPLTTVTDRPQEARSEQKVITLEANPKVFETMLHYFYHSFYDDSARGDTSVSEHAILVYAMADQYDFPRLRDAAAMKFKDFCNPQNDVEEFIDAIYAVENNTSPLDRTLWNILFPKIKSNILQLLASPNFVKLTTVDMPLLAVQLMGGLDPSAPFGTGSVPPVTLPTRPSAHHGDAQDQEFDDDDQGSVPGQQAGNPSVGFRQRMSRSARKQPPRGGMGPGRRLG